MVIFLYGPDTFRLSRKLQEIIEACQQKTRNLNFTIFDGASQNFNDFLVKLRQASLFEEKKLIVVHQAGDEHFTEGFLKNISQIQRCSHNIILCHKGKILKTDKLLSAVKKIGKTQEFNELSGIKLANWITAEFERYNSIIEPEAAMLLGSRLGGDLWYLSNEIHKLAFNGQKIITTEIINQNFKGKIELNIFKTIDAIAAKNKPEALYLIHKHINQGDSPLYLMAMIANQLRNLLAVKYFFEVEGGIYNTGPARLKMNPFVFSKTAQQSRSFTFGRIRDIFKQLVFYDTAIKTGKIEAAAAIDFLIIQI